MNQHQRVKGPSLAKVIEKYRHNRDVQLGVAVESMNVQLGNYLRETRINLGISLESLAEKLDLRTDHLSTYESGKSIHTLSISFLNHWACQLGLQVTISAKPFGGNAERSAKE